MFRKQFIISNKLEGVHIMPSKHIKDETWELIEDLRIRGIIETKADIKERELLNLILKKGQSLIKTLKSQNT